MSSIIAIMPVYNHASRIGAVLDGCLAFFNRDDILVVDDGSTDYSAAEAGKRLVHIRRHQKNRGKGQALITGFGWAISRGAEWVLTLDADGQHIPEEIPRFLSAAKQNAGDLIIGKRDFSLGKMPFSRWLSNSLSARVLSWVTGRRIEDSQSGYRLIRTDILKKMAFHTSDYMLETEVILLAAKMKARIAFVPITTRYAGEKSHIRSMNIVTRFIQTVWANRKQIGNYRSGG